MRRVWFALLALSLSVAITSAARQRPDRGSPASFRFERPVETSGGGARRLRVDVPLLSGARRDLADLRLFGAAGDEIPYLLLRPVESAPVWTGATVLPIPTTEKTSGFEADVREPLTVDGIRVGGLPFPLLKRLSLEGSGDREHWTVLLPEATLFDLPSENLQQLDLSFTPGDYRYLRVTWNDANSGRVALPSRVQARRVTPATWRQPPLTTTVSVEQRPSEPGISRYRLRLPAPRLPVVSLMLVVDNDRVMRHATVTEPRLSGPGVVPVELGRATLKRIVRDQAAAESLKIAIAAPRGPQLDLAIDDGSNPPLRITSVAAVFERQPDVYFEAGGAPVVARYGDDRLRAPRYDLEAARETIQIDSVMEAKWGEPRPLTPEDSPPATSSAAVKGATVDAREFETVRDIPAGQAGLVSLEMDAAALAHSTGPDRRFSDVRIVDADGRQVPYLVEHCVTPLLLDLSLERRQPRAAADAARNVSEYRVFLPYPGLPAPSVVLMTSARVFARRVTLGSERPADRSHRDVWLQTLADTDWSHEDSASVAPSLVLQLPPIDATELLLRVEEGDNAPLPLTGAKLMLPGYRLRFYRGAGDSLQLAYGRADLESPRYDIRLLANEVLGSQAAEVRASSEPPSRLSQRSPLVSLRLFWIVLVGAVLVLVALAVRLVRRS